VKTTDAIEKLLTANIIGTLRDLVHVRPDCADVFLILFMRRFAERCLSCAAELERQYREAKANEGTDDDASNRGRLH
jgi:hypothetical protein